MALRAPPAVQARELMPLRLATFAVAVLDAAGGFAIYTFG